jgi:benzodiazapine receptor
MADAALKPGWWKLAIVAVVVIEAIGSLSGFLSNSGYGNVWFGLSLFAVQMVLNFAWSPLFFALHDIRLAKYVIFLMAIIAAAAAGQFFRLRRAAGLLMVPYLAWLIFAATLNSTIEALNPGAGASLFG